MPTDCDIQDPCSRQANQRMEQIKNRLDDLLPLLDLAASTAQFQDLRNRVDRNNRNILRGNNLVRLNLGGTAQLRQMSQATLGRLGPRMRGGLSRQIGRLGSAVGQIHKLGRITLGGVARMGQMAQATLGRLGPRMRGGLSRQIGRAGSAVGQVFSRVGKFIDWAVFDRVLNIMTLITALHNAYFLSREVVESIMDLMSNALKIFGIKDAEGKAFDLEEIIGKSISEFLNSIFGENNVKEIRQTIAKYSRIYQAASNMLWSVTSMFDAAREVAEWTAENTGKIGNALKKAGVVFENAYRWLPERINAASVNQRRFDRFYDGLESIEDTASSLNMVTMNIREIQDEASEFKEAKDRFKEAIKTATPKERPDNEPVKDASDAAKASAQKPGATEPDLDKDD